MPTLKLLICEELIEEREIKYDQLNDVVAELKAKHAKLLLSFHEQFILEGVQSKVNQVIKTVAPIVIKEDIRPVKKIEKVEAAVVKIPPVRNNIIRIQHEPPYSFFIPYEIRKAFSLP